MSGLEHSEYGLKVTAFTLIQVSYLSYIHKVKPHDEPEFNKLEFLNEYGLLALSYAMLGFVTSIESPRERF